MTDAKFEMKRCTVETELKAEDEMVFTGLASTFGNTDLDGDVVEKGAFEKSLRKRRPRRVKMLWQHDSRMPIGVFNDIKETKDGLLVEGKLVDTTLGLDAHKLLKAGAIDSMSIGFRTVVDEIDRDKNVRLLKEIDLLEISLVSFPANEKARVQGVKAADILTIRDFENFLRDVGGFSNTAAKAIASSGFEASLDHRDDAELGEWFQSFQRRAQALKGTES